jgi:cellobiose-specific phosphotransferase system component IIA
MVLDELRRLSFSILSFLQLAKAEYQRALDALLSADIQQFRGCLNQGRVCVEQARVAYQGLVTLNEREKRVSLVILTLHVEDQVKSVALLEKAIKQMAKHLGVDETHEQNKTVPFC